MSFKCKKLSMAKKFVRKQSELLLGTQFSPPPPVKKSTPISDNVRRRRSVRKQRFYGSVELLVSVDRMGRIKNVGRFRLEPGPEQNPPRHNSVQISLSTPSSPVVLENPQAETRWYFKFFLGKEHQIFSGIEPTTKTPFFLCILVEEDQGTSKCRAILWDITGPKQRLFQTSVLPKPITAKSVLLKFPSMTDYSRSLKEINSPKLQKDLMVLEEQEGSLNLKFGVIFAQTGQMSDEEMLSNEHGNDEFQKFMSILGQKVDLKGWGSFRGGLDTAGNSTGTESLYTTYVGHEIMFHVSTMLPYTSGQQIERKRHIGNDIVNIIFESGPHSQTPTFNPSMMKSQFTHIFALVTFDKDKGCYRLWVFSEESVPAYGPALPSPAEFYDPQIFREFLLTKLLNGEKASFNASAFVEKRSRTNENLLRDMYMEHMKDEGCPKTFHMTSEPLVRSKLSSPQNKQIPVDMNAFTKFGELLKLETMLSGEAPEYYLSHDKKTLNKKYPWEPLLIQENIQVPNVIAADSWGHKEIVMACEEEGVLAMKNTNLVCVVEPYAKVEQISILENFGIVLMRCKGKECYLSALPLCELKYRIKSGTAFFKSDCFTARIPATKGIQLYALTDVQGLRLSCAVAVARKVLLFRWAEGLITKVNSLDEIPAKFTLLHEISINEDVLALSVYESAAFGSIRSVTVSKNSVQLIDFNIWTAKTICQLNTNKPEILSVLTSADAENNEEVLVTFDNTTIIIDISELEEDQLTPSLEVYWTSNPKGVVYNFPFLLAFTDDVIEVRLGINGNLLSTIFMPQVQLLTSKSDILLLGAGSSPDVNSNAESDERRINLYRIPFNSLTSNGVAPNLHNRQGTLGTLHSPILQRVARVDESRDSTGLNGISRDLSRLKTMSPDLTSRPSDCSSFDSDSGFFGIGGRQAKQSSSEAGNSLPHSPANFGHVDVFDTSLNLNGKPAIQFAHF